MGIVSRVYHEIKVHTQAEYRFTYTKPPLAQLPSDLEDIYRPDPGWPWYCWDWDQCEPRFLAVLSEDQQLQREIDEGWDRHTIITCAIFGLPYPPTFINPSTSPECDAWRREVRWQGKGDKRRRAGKSLGLALSYGKDPNRAWDMPGFKSLGLKKGMVTRGAHNFLLRYPQMLQWRREQAEYALKHREVRDWMGGRWALLGDDPEKLKRQSWNGPCQIGVSRLHNQVFVEIWSGIGPEEVLFKYGGHDAQRWAVREAHRENTRLWIKEIVLRPRLINGKQVVFPASFKWIEA